MARFVPGCALVAVLVAMTGCVAVPVPVGSGKITSGQEVRPEQLEMLVDPSTTRQEIVELMGEPDFIWGPGSVACYYWTKKKGEVWVATPYSSAGHDISDTYALLLQFDEHDRIIRIGHFLNETVNSDFLRKWISQPLPDELPTLEELIKDHQNEEQ